MKKILLIALISQLLISGCSVRNDGRPEQPLNDPIEGRAPIELMKDKKILFVAVPNFRDGELIIPKNILSEQGAEIHFASLKKGNFSGNEGLTVEAEYDLKEVESESFDAVVFIGGPGMTRELENEDLQNLAREFLAKGKLTAAICIAPAMLGGAGALKGKKATVFPTGKGYLIEGGADYTAKSVERDGLIITADGPESAAAFAYEIINALK